jgi:hypothetical protein
MPTRDGVEVEVVGKIAFDEDTGYACTARAKGPDGWEFGSSYGDSLAKAREAAFALAVARVKAKRR